MSTYQAVAVGQKLIAPVELGVVVARVQPGAADFVLYLETLITKWTSARKPHKHKLTKVENNCLLTEMLS